MHCDTFSTRLKPVIESSLRHRLQLRLGFGSFFCLVDASSDAVEGVEIAVATIPVCERICGEQNRLKITTDNMARFIAL